MKLLLGAYNQVGLDVLKMACRHPLLDEVCLFTHESSENLPNLVHEAKKLGIWSTIGRLGDVDPPFAPDMISLVYYRHIVTADVIKSVGGKIFNAHPSLLPKHRGCSSVPWAIIDGDPVTGVSYHYVEPGIDTGRIITQSVVPIDAEETAASLYRRCMDRASDLWPAALALVAHGFPGLTQEGPPTYHPRGAPLGGEIDPAWSDDFIARFIRAMVYPPAPYATYLGHEVPTFSEFLRIRERYT
jgi:methionyl-tRNA formyltransferase